MRAVAQRASSARIRVPGGAGGPEDAEPPSLAEMGAGLRVLVGVGREDGPEDAERLARRLVDWAVYTACPAAGFFAR